MSQAKETPGSTTRLIIRHVRRRAGDVGVSAVLERANVAERIDQLMDESVWVSYDDKLALFEAAAAVLEDPLVGLHVGDELLDGPVGELVDILRALGSPGEALRAIIAASDSYSPAADMDLLELGDQHAVISYRLHDGYQPNRHDCFYTAGLIRQIGPVFGLPRAEVDHSECRLDGAATCVFRVAWSATPRARRLGRRVRRNHVRALAARFWALESDTPDLIGEGEPSTVLNAIAARAAETVGASGHVLVLTDPDASAPRVIQHGLVGGAAALVDNVFQGLVEQDDPGRLVVELASARRRHGHLVLLFDDGHEPIPEERTILQAYARHTAVALDAAHAIQRARLREETASVLLDLARALAELTTLGEVTTRIAEAVPAVTTCDQAALLLWDEATETFRVAAATGYPEAMQHVLDGLVVPDDVGADEIPDTSDTGPLVIRRAEAKGLLASLMDDHGVASVALVPIRLRGRLQGMIAAGWRVAGTVPSRHVLDERLVGLADQAATAIENATLLEQVRHQALHDALTGLPNQTLFADRVATEITRAKRNGTRVALGVLDLDRFKTVNDSLGHSAGDQLLVQVADRLAHAVRAPDTIARMGGDEFTLLFPDIVERGESIVAERILEAFVQPFEIDGHRLRISPSMGLAVFPDDGDAFQGLLRCADVAMYRAKERGRNTWACYASGMAERSYDRLTLETGLYRALQGRELRVAYQPIARVSDGKVVGTEALVRWAHPTLGLLLPDDFLPIAEDLGLMAEIDGWVLRHACRELGNASATGVEIDHVSVNLSARTICHPALERLVMDALAAGGIEPSRLVLEVSEAITADPGFAAGDALQRLRKSGVRVALDDFGRGHSALSRLDQLPIDRLKVDATFLTAADDAASPAPVVEAIVAMGHGLGLEVCAEGVESDAHHAFAARLGFDLAQGWLIGRPSGNVDYAGARSRTA